MPATGTPNARTDFCYVTTIGRHSREPRTVEIWFGYQADTVYLLSGGGGSAHWVKNIEAHPAVRVRIGRRTWDGLAHIVDDPQEDALARRLLAAKYQDWRQGKRLSSWARTALPVAIRLRS